MNVLESEDESIVLLSIEFYASICENELELLNSETKKEPTSEQVKYDQIFSEVLPYLLRILLSQVYAESDQDWTPIMASSTVIGLFAEILKDNVLVDGKIIHFIEASITSEKWHHRDAALLAFGQIVYGPGTEVISSLLHPFLGYVLHSMQDSSVHVRDTASWVIGRINEFCSTLLSKQEISDIIHALVSSLNDLPRVSINCCWALMNLSIQVSGLIENSLLSLIMSSILRVSCRPDSEQEHLRTLSLEALSNIVEYCPSESNASVSELLNVLVAELQCVLSSSTATLTSFHSGLMIVLQTCIKNLSHCNMPALNMSVLVPLFSHYLDRTCTFVQLFEDGILAFSELLTVNTPDLEPFSFQISQLILYLMQKSISSPFQFGLLLGLIGDFCRNEQFDVKQAVHFRDIISTHMKLNRSNLNDIKYNIETVGDISIVLQNEQLIEFITPFVEIFLELLGEVAEILSTADTNKNLEETRHILRCLSVSSSSFLQGLAGLEPFPSVSIAYLDQLSRMLSLYNFVEHLGDEDLRALLALIGDAYSPLPDGLLEKSKINILFNLVSRCDINSSETEDIQKWVVSLFHRL